MLAESIGHSLQSAAPITVVRVQDGYNFTCRTLNPLIHSVVMTFVRFRNPFQVRVLFENVNGAIGRAAIDDQMFPLALLLHANTLNRFTDRMNAVETGSDDRDARLLPHRQEILPQASLPLSPQQRCWHLLEH